MTAVLRCLDGGQNGLLESPTGTGKFSTTFNTYIEKLSTQIFLLKWNFKSPSPLDFQYFFNGPGPYKPFFIFAYILTFSSGKTLSLLCSTLAWLERTRAEQQLKALVPAADAGQVMTEWMPPVRHKIIYSSRLCSLKIFSLLIINNNVQSIAH